MSSINITIPNNKFCIIDTTDPGIIKIIDKEFSYKQNGSEYSYAAKNFGWNGIIHLLIQRKEQNLLPLGLLEFLKTLLSKIGYGSVIIDKRLPLLPTKEIDLKPKLASLNIQLRDYQEKIVDTAFKNRKGIIRAATGSGKSICIASLVAKLNRPTIIGVIGIDLLDQFHKTMTELFDEEIGYIGNGVCNIKRLNVCSIWTLGKSLGVKKDIVDDDSNEKEILKIENTEKIVQILKTTKTFLFDECHSIGTETFKHIYKIIDPQTILGFSATPYRDDDHIGLFSNSILGPQIINVSASELIQKGYLAKPYIKFINVPKKPNLSNKDYHSVYKEYVVDNKERNKLVIDSAKYLLGKGLKVLILFRQISHGNILQEMFNDENIDVGLLSGKDSLEKRNEIKDQMNSGKINLILASSIFDIGVDLPILSGLVLAAPSKSSGRLLQRCGRILRPLENKTKVAIIDFVDNVKYLKQHSLKRYETYKSEDGFEVSWPNNLK